VENQLSKTFERFVVGPNNNIAFTVLKNIAENAGREGKYPILYIYSSSGLGKTHLLEAFTNEVNQRHPKLNVSSITARKFLDEMITLMKNNRINDLLKKYSEDVDILIIDDVHEFKNEFGRVILRYVAV
jgi:chromosomal replication initiator protein